MTVDYTAAAADAAAGITEGGMAAALLKPGAPTGPAYSPVPGADTSHPCVVLQMTTKAEARAGTLVEGADRVFMLAGTDAVPEVSDKIEAGGAAYKVLAVEPFAPGGVPVYYTVQAAR